MDVFSTVLIAVPFEPREKRKKESSSHTFGGPGPKGERERTATFSTVSGYFQRALTVTGVVSFS